MVRDGEPSHPTMVTVSDHQPWAVHCAIHVTTRPSCAATLCVLHAVPDGERYCHTQQASQCGDAQRCERFHHPHSARDNVDDVIHAVRMSPCA